MGNSKEARFLWDGITAGLRETPRRSLFVWPQAPMSAFLFERQGNSRIGMLVADAVMNARSEQNVQTRTSRGRG